MLSAKAQGHWSAILNVPFYRFILFFLILIMINAEAVYGTNRLPEGKCFLCTLDTINYNIIQSKLCHLFFLKSKQFDL